MRGTQKSGGSSGMVTKTWGGGRKLIPQPPGEGVQGWWWGPPSGGLLDHVTMDR